MPVSEPPGLVKRTWRMSPGDVVPMPTRPALSNTAESPTSAALTYLERKLTVPGSTACGVGADGSRPETLAAFSPEPAAGVADDSVLWPSLLVGASTYAEAGRPPSVSASATRSV